MLFEEADHRSILDGRVTADSPDAVTEQDVCGATQQEPPETSRAVQGRDCDVIDRSLLESASGKAPEDHGEHEACG